MYNRLGLGFSQKLSQAEFSDLFKSFIAKKSKNTSLITSKSIFS